MGTYVKNGNSCIGCLLLEGFPERCGGCRNLKSKAELMKIVALRDEEIKKLRDALNLILVKCTDHDEYSRFEDYKQLTNDIISICGKTLFKETS